MQLRTEVGFSIILALSRTPIPWFCVYPILCCTLLLTTNSTYTLFANPAALSRSVGRGSAIKASHIVTISSLYDVVPLLAHSCSFLLLLLLLHSCSFTFFSQRGGIRSGTLIPSAGCTVYPTSKWSYTLFPAEIVRPSSITCLLYSQHPHANRKTYALHLIIIEI